MYIICIGLSICLYFYFVDVEIQVEECIEPKTEPGEVDVGGNSQLSCGNGSAALMNNNDLDLSTHTEIRDDNSSSIKVIGPESSATDVLNDKLDNIMAEETDSRNEHALHGDTPAEAHSLEDKTEYTASTEGTIIDEI